MADAVPAHLRGAGFGAFNLVSILFGAAAAPIIVGALADVWNLRVAFLLVVAARVHRRVGSCSGPETTSTPTPPKIFEAVVRAMQQDQERSSS